MRIPERRLQNAAWLLHVEPEALREAALAHLKALELERERDDR